MAVIRIHLATKGLGLFNDLQNEHSVVGNFPDVLMVREFGSQEQKEVFIKGRLEGSVGVAFGLTEKGHGSDATHMSTCAERKRKDEKEGWVINGGKMWISGMHSATHVIVFARTSGTAGDALGITAFFVPRDAEGFVVESFEWTFNMPTDHASESSPVRSNLSSLPSKYYVQDANESSIKLHRRMGPILGSIRKSRTRLSNSSNLRTRE